MAKTLFIQEVPSEAVKGTDIEAPFLNAVNNHRHTGMDLDGHGALDYAPDTGAANAYAIALVPALTGYITGMPLWFKAAHANTGAATLAINALGPVAIKKSGASALVAGDIVAGQMVCLVYDGANFQMPAPDQGKTTTWRGTLAQIQAAAVGTNCFTAFDYEHGTVYFYPGDAAIGLIVIGGTAAQDSGALPPERG
jgi:hypothetical protein